MNVLKGIYISAFVDCVQMHVISAFKFTDVISWFGISLFAIESPNFMRFGDSWRFIAA